MEHSHRRYASWSGVALAWATVALIVLAARAPEPSQREGATHHAQIDQPPASDEAPPPRGGQTEPQAPTCIVGSDEARVGLPLAGELIGCDGGDGLRRGHVHRIDRPPRWPA